MEPKHLFELSPQQKQYIRLHTKYTVRHIADELRVSYQRVQRYRDELKESKQTV